MLRNLPGIILRSVVPSSAQFLMGLLPTGVQICVSLFRVAVFAWSVLQLDKFPHEKSILYFLGFLPFFGLFDVFLQSWSRTAHAKGAAWTVNVGLWRVPYAILALAAAAAAFTLTYRMPLANHGTIFLSVLSLLGSVALLWERWLAATARALSAGFMEIAILVASIALYSFNPANPALLIFCFTGYLVSRLVSLLLPGRAASVDRVPHIGLRTHHYLGFAVGQQIMGSISASVPSLFALLTGNNSGLGAALAMFRIMHSLAATAALFVNALGARLFFGEAAKEQVTLQKISSLMQRYRTPVDIICLTWILFAILHNNFNIWMILLPVILTIAILNFRSSFEISQGRPNNSFILQSRVLLVSVFMAALIYSYFKIAIILILFYILFSAFSEKIMS